MRGQSTSRRGPGPALGPWHLLWAAPVALASALALTVLAGIAYCGVSGCSGGGFGTTAGLRPLAVGLLCLAGVVLAVPLVLTRWSGRASVRLAAGAAVAGGWTVWSWTGLVGDRGWPVS